MIGSPSLLRLLTQSLSLQFGLPRDSQHAQTLACRRHPAHIILVRLVFYLPSLYYLFSAAYARHFTTFYIDIY